VGDQENVRGISGGEKKRVTVAEMLCVGSPIICCDEISTGLDGKWTSTLQQWVNCHDMDLTARFFS
jgi:ABC-type multidrug transport system ATPase subunit